MFLFEKSLKSHMKRNIDLSHDMEATFKMLEILESLKPFAVYPRAILDL